MAEGSAATYTVKLGGDLRGTADVAVTYTVGGTAKAPADYAAPSRRVVIEAGQQTASFAIQTRTDKVLEPDETLVVTLTDASTAAGSATVGSPAKATTAIQIRCSTPSTGSTRRCCPALRGPRQRARWTR